MWLYYFPYFVELILKNLASDKKFIDDNAKFPTRYHYALYEMTECLCRWIKAIEYIPLKQDNVVLESVDTTYENGNIPKSSMLALDQTVKEILVSDIISSSFKILHNGYGISDVF